MPTPPRWRDRLRTPAEELGSTARDTLRVGWNARLVRSARVLALLLPRYANHRGPRADALFLALAGIVGLLGAVGVQLFFNAIDLANDALVGWPTRFGGPGLKWVIVPAFTAASLALAAWIMRRFGNGHDGLNVPDVADAVARHGGRLPTRQSLAKSLASAVTIGGGGSAGSEGPVAVLGAALGSWFARPLRLRPDRVRMLVGAGSAAGISATFGAPLAGAFFALEEILKSSSGAAFAPVVIASVVAYASSLALFGADAPFPDGLTYSYSHAREVFFYFPLLGVIAGLAGGLFVRIEDAMARARWRTQAPPPLVPWIGGILVGLILLGGRGLLTSRGHFTIDFEALVLEPWTALLVLALAKIAATVITLNAGGSGGVFAPSLLIGAMVGTAVAKLLLAIDPGVAITPGAYALAGMGALVAASTGAPITATLLVFEITSDNDMILPLMLSVACAVTVRRMITRKTLYSAWLERTGRRLPMDTGEYGVRRPAPG
jgi:CIC family chloride channel protein